MAADYPTTPKTFTTKADGPGNTISAAHMNAVQDEITALEAALLTSGLAHHLKFVDATYDIGQSGATRPRHLYMSGNAVIGGNVTITGTLAVTGLATITGDVLSVTDGHPSTTPSAVGGKALIYVDGSDGDLKVRFGDGTIKLIVADT